MMVDGNEDEEEIVDGEEVPDVEIVYSKTDEIQDEEEAMGEEEEEDFVVEDMAEITFTQHKGSVFCVAISSSEKYLLSGGEDDTAYICDIENEEAPLHKIEGHKDSVTHVGFSSTDKYYFTADLAGYIQLFELENHKKIWDFEVGDVRWVMWHPIVPILLAGSDEGGVWMWKVPSFETKTIQLSSVPPVGAAFMSTNRHLVVGYQDGFVKIVDLKSGEATVSVETKHEITSIGVSSDDHLIMTGTASSFISLIGTQSGKVLSSLSEHVPGSGVTAHSDKGSDSVEHITFHPKRSLAAVSYVKDRVIVWDTALQRIRTTLQHPDGVVKAEWAGDSEHHLVTCCLDGLVRVWDVDQSEVVAEVTGNTSQLLDMTITQNLVATAADDGSVRVFRIS